LPQTLRGSGRLPPGRTATARTPLTGAVRLPLQGCQWRTYRGAAPVASSRPTGQGAETFGSLQN
jgi:hypothetical protein